MPTGTWPVSSTRQERAKEPNESWLLAAIHPLLLTRTLTSPSESDLCPGRFLRCGPQYRQQKITRTPMKDRNNHQKMTNRSSKIKLP